MSTPHQDQPVRDEEADDTAQSPRLRIKYEAPLPWLVGLIGIGIAQAAALYYGQQRQGELIAAQSAAIEQLRVEVKGLASAVGAKDLADVRHDLQIADHERRLSHLEKGKP